MTALPEDSWFRSIRPQPSLISAEEYEELPEEISRAIEIVGGYVAYCEAPSPRHQIAGRRLANLLEGYAKEAMSHGYECLTVANDVDLRLRDVPLHNRRPDVVLYRCLDEEGGERLRAQHALLVVEIVSPGSVIQDTVDKLAEYAKSGIPHYWIVHLDQTGVSTIERYRLDPASMLYKNVGTLMTEADPAPTITNPLPLTINWDDLQF
ncbi:Uma2 family endonuclease [Nonomuraea sp. SYSU D8015]|uniref:Uma2 family endonuclease n=1 Tax=Nonomuraea sp. SYSU D8015 TaxID=2593644 RepID=UPI0016602A2B|nr:Uma2 family endonuclease [Nonomuraea sp. SYSU D8015]